MVSTRSRSRMPSTSARAKAHRHQYLYEDLLGRGRFNASRIRSMSIMTLKRRVIFNQCRGRSEEHTSELQSLMRISYAVFCLKKTKITHKLLQKTNTKTAPTQFNEYIYTVLKY